MRLSINIEKKHFYFLVGIISFFGIVTVFAASPFNSGLGFHPLQQISKSDSNLVSVDLDLNEIIDNADKLGGFGVSSFCMSNGTNCASSQQTTNYAWSDPGSFVSQSCTIFAGINQKKTGSCTTLGATNDYEIAGSNCGAESQIVSIYRQTCQ